MLVQSPSGAPRGAAYERPAAARTVEAAQQFRHRGKKQLMRRTPESIDKAETFFTKAHRRVERLALVVDDTDVYQQPAVQLAVASLMDLANVAQLKKDLPTSNNFCLRALGPGEMFKMDKGNRELLWEASEAAVGAWETNANAKL